MKLLEPRLAVNRLPLPETVETREILWRNVIGVGAFHVLALLAFVPWLFSWTGVALVVAGLYVFGTLGINLCYHRLLTHRSFACPPWLEHTFALLGVCCQQETPIGWVAVHRLHHQHSDEQADPHSPLVSFLWSHMGWLFVQNREFTRLSVVAHYTKDLLTDRFYKNLERNGRWLWINVAHWFIFYFAGFFIGWATGAGWLDGVQFGLSLLVWGVIVRTVLVWHITWSVNSVTHLWGYRNYETNEFSRNNIFIGLVSNGEGWHNNHHAEPRAAAHGHRWWEFDVTYLTIRGLQLVGLAWDLVPAQMERPEQAPESAQAPALQEANAAQPESPDESGPHARG